MSYEMLWWMTWMSGFALGYGIKGLLK